MRPVQKLHPPRRPDRRGNVPLLVRKPVKRHAKRRSQHRGLTLPREKAGHIAALHRARAGGHADGAGFAQIGLRRQPLQNLRQLPHMLKQRVALPQAKRPGPHRKQLRAVAGDVLADGRGGGCVVACVKPEEDHFAASRA